MIKFLIPLAFILMLLFLLWIVPTRKDDGVDLGVIIGNIKDEQREDK